MIARNFLKLILTRSILSRFGTLTRLWKKCFLTSALILNPTDSQKNKKMIKKIGFYVSVVAFALLQSCSVNTETTYYKDAASSMESNILMDKTMIGMMNVAGSSAVSKDIPNLSELPTEWKSLYDLQKKGKIVLNEKEAGALKKMYIKLNKDKGEILGLSLKYDKLLPVEVAQLFASKRELKNIPLQDFGRWDGEKLEIDTEKFNIAESLSEIQKVKPEEKTGKPQTKQDSIEAYGRQMASGVVGMLRMFNGNFTNTLKFQKPITKIEGKHDFVQQIDDKTIRINVRTNDLWDEGKNLKNKDKKIIVYTK